MTKFPDILDTHLHLWDRSKFKVGWTNQSDYFNKEFLLSDYRQDVKGLPVKALFMEVDSDIRAKGDEYNYVNGLIDQPSNFLVGGTLHANPLTIGFKDLIETYGKNDNVVGIRTVLHNSNLPRGLCLQKRFVNGIGNLGEHGLKFDLCIRSTELEDAIKLVAQCPNTIFIIDHAGCSNPEFEVHNPVGTGWQKWNLDMRVLGAHTNVYCKLSGLVSQLSSKEDIDKLSTIIKKCLSYFPIERILIGSDWPICTLISTARHWFESLFGILVSQGISRSAIEKIFSKNAINLYDLEYERSEYK